MSRHFTPADYIRQPWANGRGVTVELARADGPDGLIWRLSMATVAEDGAFSLFPGIERNLTVISGPGFRLEGSGLALDALPLTPIAFPGDIALAATGVIRPSEDFNVMTARSLAQAEVAAVIGEVRIAGGEGLAVFALAPAFLSGRAMGRHDLVFPQASAHLSAPGGALVVRLPGPCPA